MFARVCPQHSPPSAAAERRTVDRGDLEAAVRRHQFRHYDTPTSPLGAAQHLGGMPSNKFQLKHVERGFLKDKKTLAFHNLAGAVQIEVTLRKRRR